ncbi:hypothetical protein [Spiroplasma floricola]|uniref:Uncharacterized protein n=1 Tax=Spiroplasma floricola 23-6 TaxID=1336749 RepID=A0A2K8SF97_9MOLU|nr:hypothetical protein [Spiroplasma floricola]AUB31918.1 hypothetical protein SFLOR_v1c08700 [Spiroplasma floricola 23-6]
MYKNKKLWATVGSRIISNMSFYKEYIFSEEELYELIANEEYLIDDSQEIYGKKLINFLQIWELIRQKIIESKENYRRDNVHKWAFKIEDYIKIYMLLDEAGEFEYVFQKIKDEKSKTLKMIEFFEESLIEEATLELFIEDMLITFIYFAIERPLGQYTLIFINLISNAMLLYRGFGPIWPSDKNEMIDFAKQASQLIIQCKGLKIEHYNRTPLFKGCYKRLLDMSENNKLILEAL